MISLDTKTQTTTSSPLNLASTDETPTVSFSSLLKGMNSKGDVKIIQNGALVLSLEKSTENIKENPKSGKKDTLLSLLKSEEFLNTKTIEPLVINPKITEKLSVKDIKGLIKDAKVYLKDKILQSDEYKNAQIKDIPKTLKGLTELAQKIGINVSKITIEEVQVKPIANEIPKTVVKESIKQELNTKTDVKQELKQEVQFKADVKQEVKPEVQLRADVKQEVKPEIQLKAAVKQEVKPEVQLKADLKQEVKPEVQLKAAVKQEVKPELQLKAKVKNELKQDVKQQITTAVDNKKIDITPQKDLSVKTPLFQAQSTKEHTTEQLVSTKQFKVEEKTPSARADETLKLLLRGDKTVQTNSTLTADFSVATARVIAPGATSEATKSLETLLRGESSEGVSKTDGLTIHKADSFEVKLNEAKQMIKYLSADVKTAIEDYKPPFTRIKVQLNPQKLGEVDVTLVQRGKNLHVNISSNSTAINTLAANVNDLRVQLSSNGINNATLNFNNSSQGEQQQHSGQQNRQNEQEAHEEYNYFENEETNEEILSSLEIVVPNYA